MTDRDLLVLEPTIFRDIGWLSQRLCDGQASAIGSTLTATKPIFDDARVRAGHVVVVAGAALEVIERTSPTQLVVSRLRERTGDPPIPPLGIDGGAFTISTFGPQLAAAHDHALRALGLDPASGGPAVTDPAALGDAVRFGALHLVFSAAALAADDRSLHWAKAQMYRTRYTQARARLAVRLDTDADGAPDAARRAAFVPLRRD